MHLGLPIYPAELGPFPDVSISLPLLAWHGQSGNANDQWIPDHALVIGREACAASNKALQYGMWEHWPSQSSRAPDQGSWWLCHSLTTD